MRRAAQSVAYSIDTNAMGKSIQAQHMLDFEATAIKIGPGEHFVAESPETVIVTVLGSCISVCIRDPHLQVGGMNHFMLPESRDGIWGNARASLRFGNFAMERLVNDILVRGGRRERLEIKVVGGGNVLDNAGNIGHRNAEFIEQYLLDEGLSVLSVDLRGDCARRVHYLPYDGRLWVKRLPRDLVAEVRAVEISHYCKIETATVGGSIEVF